MIDIWVGERDHFHLNFARESNKILALDLDTCHFLKLPRRSVSSKLPRESFLHRLSKFSLISFLGKIFLAEARARRGNSAMILRKVWGSVWSRSSSGKDSASQSAIQAPLSPPASSSLGAFDHLPMDILIQILMLVEPRDAVKLSLTCKAWRCLAGGNRLWIFYLQCSQESWDSIFFAETSLRSGYPLRWDYEIDIEDCYRLLASDDLSRWINVCLGMSIIRF